MDNLIKKNILDLEFQKNLVIASTTAVLFFTYLIGIGIGFATKQIGFNLYSLLALFFLTLAIGVPFIFLYLSAVSNIKTIPLLLEQVK